MKNILFILHLLLSVLLCAEELSGKYTYENIDKVPYSPLYWDFDKNQYIFNESMEDEFEFTGSGSYEITEDNIWKWIELNPIDYIDWKMVLIENCQDSGEDCYIKQYTQIDNGPYRGNRLLALYSEDILYFQNPISLQTVALGRNTNNSMILWSFYSNPEDRQSSYLIEGDTNYSVENLFFLNWGEKLPWVEGVDGYGIGEWVELGFTTQFDSLRNRCRPLSSIIISNGYVKADRTDLYYKNSRVKKLRVTSTTYPELDYIIELDDTPQPQTFDLPIQEYEKSILIPYENTFLKFEILDVYPGTQWEDSCLNFIAGISNEAIDFEY